MEPEQEGGLYFLSCNHCGYRVNVEAPPTPKQQEVINIEGIPGMPGMRISANLGTMSSDWMDMVASMNQKGLSLPPNFHELPPERQQAALSEVQAFMGDDMAMRIGQIMQAQASGKMVSGQPMVFGSVQSSQQSWGAPVMQPMGQIAGPPPERSAQPSGLKWLLIAGAVVAATLCLFGLVVAGFVLIR
jgi:hypothetical protein